MSRSQHGTPTWIRRAESSPALGSTRRSPACEPGHTQGIAVARLDRFSRAGVADALRVIQEIHDLGGELAAVDYGLDPTTPFGEFGMTILLGLARMQRRQTGESWDIARERAVARGVHIASKTPTGYVRRDDGRLEAHPEFAVHVTNVFRLRAGGASWRDLCAYLNERGVVGPYGPGQVWRTRAVTHMVRNRVYLGEARSGEHVNAHAHQPLIDARTWEKAQEARSAPPSSRREPALLAGLLRCAGCRYLMKPDTMRARDGESLRLYRCRGEHAGGTCAARASTLGRVIEPFVVDAFFDMVRVASIGPAARGRDLDELEAAVVAADAELVAFRDSESLTALGDVYVDGVKVRADRLARAERALADARAEFDTPEVPDIDTLEAVWDELPVEDRRRLLLAGMDTVMLRSGRTLAVPDRVHVFWRGEAPDDLPRRGKRPAVVPFPWPDSPDG
jgi:hypothetical protein